MSVKTYLLLALILCSCGKHDDHHDQAPAATPTPVPTPTAVTVTGPAPRFVDRDSLPDDYGFTATYAKLPSLVMQFYGSETVVKVAKNHLQLSNKDAVLDCRFTDQPTPTMRYLVNGKKQKLDNFHVITCFVADQLSRPIRNLKDLCDAYGCEDSKIGDFETTRVLSADQLVIEKSSNIRVQSGNDTIMIKKVAGAPKAEEFEIVETP